MRLQEHANKLETNVQAETQNFGIGDASVVIEILRNRLYEHKIRTLVQEYICNARDAMRELGKGTDFEITVPTALNPVFKVRDFGPGISPDRMKDVFVMYGASTKRGSNLQTGGFGIGAKSAWSYTDSFTITTFIDGTKRVYIAHTGVNNNGRLDHVATSKTDEANGTEIQVPVNKGDGGEFQEAIFRSIYFWEVKPTLKGELEVPETISGYKLNDTLELIDGNLLPGYLEVSSYRRELVVSIDGVPYPITERLIEKSKNISKLLEIVTKKVIFHIGNGVLEVSASRESVADSKQSIAALDKLAAQAIVSIKTHLVNEFAKVNSTNEYFKTYSELSRYFAVDKYAKYGEYTIQNGVVKSELFKKVKMTMLTTIGRRSRVTDKITRTELKEEDKYVQIKHIGNMFYLKAEESAIKQNKRLREYFLNKGNTHLVLIEPLNGNTTSLDTLIADLGVKDLQSLTWVEVPKEEKVKVVREKEEFCVHSLAGRDRHVYITLDGNTEKWFYIEMDGTSWGKDGVYQYKELAFHLKETLGINVCGVTGRALKMVQGNDNFSPLNEYLENFKPNKKQLNYVKRINAKNHDTMKLVVQLKGLEDDLLNQMIKEYKSMERSEVESLPEVLISKVKETDDFKEFEVKDNKLNIRMNKYPLLSELSYYNVRHQTDIVIYMNAKNAVK